MNSYNSLVEEKSSNPVASAILQKNQADLSLKSQRPVALSATSAKDFLQCPLKYRFRAVEQLPEVPSAEALRGTLVHSVIEKLFLLPSPERTLSYAQNLLLECWKELSQKTDEKLLNSISIEEDSWIRSAERIIENYFLVENPCRLQPANTEIFVEVRTTLGTILRGFIDRLDISPTGIKRVVDYKTGKSPSPMFQDSALFQMKFYALMLLYRDGSIPSRLQLLYLKDKKALTLDPTPVQIQKFEDRLEHLWEEICRSVLNDNLIPKVSKICNWCSFKSICPAQGHSQIEPISEEAKKRFCNTIPASSC